MKKVFTLSVVLALGASVHADELKILSCGEGVPGQDAPQLMTLGMSADGRYLCGAIEMGAGIFVADTKAGEVKWSLCGDEGGELRHIDNRGVAIGFSEIGITYSFDKPVENPLAVPDGFRGVLGEDLSDDGKVMIASLSAQSFNTAAAYSTDGENWNLLPIPTEEERGNVCPRTESAAKVISGDGKVILGCLGSFTSPIVWIRNDAGEYEYDFFPARYVKATEADIYDPAKMLYGMSAMYMNMSDNGRYACMLGTVVDDETGDYRLVTVVYDIQEKSLKVYDEYQDVDPFKTGLYPTAICDNGTFIGTIGMPFFGSMGSFIMKAGQTQAELFSAAFPAFGEKLREADSLGDNIPTAMSADGRLITGYVFYCDDYNDEDEDAYYMSYILDTDPDVSVEGIAGDSSMAVPEAVYSLDGKRMNGMTKGVNIIRMSDGSVRKVIMK